MAASTQQKVDFLLKKIGYTASKTGLAEDSSLSGTKKAPFAEAVPSPLVIATSSVWADSEYIPGTPPGSSSSYVQVYLSGTSGHQMTVDSTVSGNRSYIAYSTYNNSSTAILGDWIDTQFGSSYIIKVYKGDPNSGGVSLSAAGSGSSDGWFFDYSSGILNFNDTNVPSGVTDSNIYVVGYRYIGGKGVLAPAGIGTFNSLEVSGVSTFSAAVDANAGADISGGIGLNVVGHTELDEVNVSGVSTYGGAIDANAGVLASTLKVEDLTATRVVLAGTGGEIEDNAKLTFTTDKLAVTGGLTVSAGATFAGIVDGNAGANISGGEATFASATVSDLTDNRVVIAGTSGALEDSGNLTFSGTKLTVTGNAQVTTDLDVDGGANISGGVGLNVVGHTELDEVNVSGVSTYGGAIDANAGIDVSGHTELDNVNVSGVATYSAAADFNAGADISGGVGLNVVGHTELDEVNVSGVSTFAGLVDGNAGANFSGAETILSSATVSDLTNNRVVLAGTAGSLEDSSSITFDGSNLAIVGGATFTGNVTIGGTLTSEDKTNVDSVGLITARTGVRITSGGLIVSAGVNTFTDAIDANGGANISGGAGLVASSAKISDLTSGRVVVAGTDGELEDASTFTVSGGTVSATAFSATNLTGTLQTAAQPNVTSLGTIANLVASRAQVTGVGGLVITGVSTFTGAVDANGGADISGGVGLNVVGHAELDEVNVSGVSTYAGAIDANAGAHISGGIGLEVVGHTEVDNFSASGVSTFAALVDGNAGANFSGAETVLSSATVSDLTENRIVIAGADGALEDASTLTFDGTKVQVGSAITMYQATGIVSATYFYGDGSNLLNAGSTLSAASAVQRVVTTSLTSGTMTTAGTDADLTFDTSSNTLNAGKVNVAGVGTFGGLIDGNAGATITGAETTLSSATVSDLTDERVVLAGSSGALEDSGNLTFNGTKLTVTGNAQVTTDLDVDGGANISGGVGLNVVGHTELDEVNISGVSTYGGAADFNAGVLANTLKVEDLSGARVVVSGTGGEIEDSANLTWVSNGANYLGLTGGLTVSAASTFSGAIDGNGGADISGGETTLSSATVSDLTSGRVVVAGTSGALEDASTFTFSGGTVSATAFSATDLTGTLQTAAQTNVTSLGTLTGLAVNGDLALHGPAGVSSVTWDKSDNALEFLDHAKATFGTGMQVFHDATDSLIKDTRNAGSVKIQADNFAVIDKDASETMLSATVDGAVILNHNGNTKFNTTSVGATVTGNLGATSISISGISTFEGNVDVNGDLDVDGHTELDYVNVSAAATFAGFLDANAGADVAGGFVANSAKVSDLTAGRVVVAGTDGELEDASTFTFSGGTVTALGFSGDITGVGATFTNVTGTLVTAAQGNVTSVGTLTGLDVNGHTELDNIQVTGIATVANVVLTKNTTGVGATIGGLNVGVVTYYGDGSQLTGIDATALKDSGGNVKVQAVTTGAVVTGLITATTGFSGDITGVGATFTNVTGTLQTAAQTNVTSLGTLTGLAVNGDLALHGPAGVSSVTWDKSDNALEFLDHAKATFGTGGDLSIYHDKSHSYIADTGTGRLHINTNQLRVNNAADDEILIDATENTGVSLYDGANTVRLATNNTGAIVTGILTATSFTGTLNTAAQANITSLGTLTGLAVNGDLALHGPAGVSSVTWDKSDNALEFLDHAKATFGTGNDLQIYHEPTNSRNRIDSRNGNISLRAEDSITFESQDSDGNNQVNLAKFLEAGACELYYSGSKKIETTFTGAIVSGMATATGGFSGDITGVGATFTNVTGTLQTAAQTNITSVGTLGGLTITGGNLVITDSSKITMGSGNVMQMNHFGGNTFLEHTSASGAFYIQGDDLRLTNKDRDETYIECDDEAGVILNYTSSKKFETTHSGAIVTGVLTATTFSGSGASLDTLNASELDSGTIPSARYGTGNTFVKLRSASAASDSGTNTFAGNGSGAALDGSSGDHNTFYGRSAGGANDTGSNNAFYGSNAGVSNVTGSNLVCVGYQADATNTSTSNEVTLGNDSITKFRVPGIGLTFTSSGVGILTATQHFSGDIVGVGATFTNVTGTLQTAAQPNITSLGTIASLVASTAKVSDLTVNRVVTVGASGELQDSANLTYNGVNLGVNGINVTGNILAPNAGNFVAIGTANALGAGTDRLAVHGSGTDSGVRIWCSASAHKATAVPLQVADTSGTEFFRVHADGKVGIGTDNPNWNLTVQGSSGTTTIASKNTGGNASVYIEASNGNTAKLELAEAGTGSYSLQVGDDNALMIFDDSTERLRITSAGRTLIGTGAVSASSNLVAQGGLQVSANGASGAPSLCVGADGTGANTQSLTDNTVKDCRIGYPNYDIDEEPLALMSGFVGDGSSLDDNDGARIYIGGGTSYLNAVNQVRFYTQNTNITTVTGTERFRIGPDGTADFQSNTVQKAVLKNYTETIKAIGNTGTSTTLDLADGNVFTATLNGNCTFTFTTGTNSAPNMQSFSLLLTNDGSAGRTIAWPASVKWPNASIPSRTTAASKTDIWSFMSPDNGTTWYGNIALYNFS